MPEQSAAKPAPNLAAHGMAELPAVTVESYNAELRDGDGFVGDRASNRAFKALLDDWREQLARFGDDPLGDTPTGEVSRKTLDKLLTAGDPEAAGVVQSAIEDFAQEFALVIRRFMRLKAWKDVERIVVGGGFRNSRIGEIAIGRTSVLLKAAGQEVKLVPIRHHPDEGGLLGAVHLAPSWIFGGHDSLLAVDIGGSNIRAGIVELHLDQAKDLSKAAVKKFLLWRHAEDKPKREEAIDRLSEMLADLVDRAKRAKLKLAPFIGIGCPGLIEEDGSIERGGQNLPGNWESSRFNLPQKIRDGLPAIGDHQTVIVMHNDAVVQGLSEVPFMQDIRRWGVLTIGTGLGNACFSNRNVD